MPVPPYGGENRPSGAVCLPEGVDTCKIAGQSAQKNPRRSPSCLSKTERGVSFNAVLRWSAVCGSELHAVEYVAARYAPLAAMLPLPDGYGLAMLLEFGPGMGLWGDLAATVWLGLLGSVLLLLRDRAAVLVLSVTVLAALVVAGLGGAWP